MDRRGLRQRTYIARCAFPSKKAQRAGGGKSSRRKNISAIFRGILNVRLTALRVFAVKRAARRER